MNSFSGAQHVSPSFRVFRIPNETNFGAKLQLDLEEFCSFQRKVLEEDGKSSWVAPLTQFSWIHPVFDLDTSEEFTDIKSILRIFSDFFELPEESFTVYRRNKGLTGGVHLQIREYKISYNLLLRISQEIDEILSRHELGLKCDFKITNYCLEGCSKKGTEDSCYKEHPDYEIYEPFPWERDVETLPELMISRKRSLEDVNVDDYAKIFKRASEDEIRLEEIFVEFKTFLKGVFEENEIIELVKENFETLELPLLFLFFFDRPFKEDSWFFLYDFFDRCPRDHKGGENLLRRVLRAQTQKPKTVKDILNCCEQGRNVFFTCLVGVSSKLLLQSGSTSIPLREIRCSVERILVNEKFLKILENLKDRYLFIDKQTRKSDEGVKLLWEIKELSTGLMIFYPLDSPGKYFLWKGEYWIIVEEHYLVEMYRKIFASRGMGFLGDRINFSREIKLKSSHWKNLTIFTPLHRDFVTFSNYRVFSISLRQFFHPSPILSTSVKTNYPHTIFERGRELGESLFSETIFSEPNEVSNERKDASLFLRCIFMWCGGNWNRIFLLLRSIREIFDQVRQKIVVHLFGQRGNNGKTLFLKIMGGFLGDYLKPVSSAILSSRFRETEPDLVAASEALVAMYDEIPRNVDADILKRLTSNAITFKRTLYTAEGNPSVLRCSWWTTGNHRWTSTDLVAVSRIRQIEFRVKFVDDRSVDRIRTIEEQRTRPVKKKIEDPEDWLWIQNYLTDNDEEAILFLDSLDSPDFIERLENGFGIVLGAMLFFPEEKIFSEERRKFLDKEIFNLQGGGVELSFEELLQRFHSMEGITFSDSPFRSRLTVENYRALVKDFLHKCLLGFEGDVEKLEEKIVMKGIERFSPKMETELEPLEEILNLVQD